MSLHDQAVGLFVFFAALCTISVGLRVFVRTKLCKNAFGWDDVALIITWAGTILWIGMAWKSMTLSWETEEWSVFVDNKNYVCYVISGVVKISVALVLYRLDTRPSIRILLIADMVICAIWTIVVTLIIGLGCTTHSPYNLNDSVCQASNYAQELSYVVFNCLHVIIPVIILWGVQINGNLKWAVIALFSVGLLAVVAAIMKLKVYVDFYNPTPETDFVVIWYQSMIWAITEHGLSLFAASILAIRPFFAFLSRTCGSLSSKLGYGSGSRKSVSGPGTGSSSRASKGSNWPSTPGGSTELGRVGVRDEYFDDGRSEYDVEDGLVEQQQQQQQQPVQVEADAYRDDEGVNSAKGLHVMSGGSKAQPEVETNEVLQ